MFCSFGVKDILMGSVRGTDHKVVADIAGLCQYQPCPPVQHLGALRQRGIDLGLRTHRADAEAVHAAGPAQVDLQRRPMAGH